MSDVTSTPAPASAENRIVVGVDGSDCANRALEYAAGEAQRTESLLQIVAVFNGVASYGSMAQPVLDQEGAEMAVRQAIERAHQVRPAVVTKGETVFGPVGPTLADVSKDASLLVVGTRGHSQIVGLLLGSVSEYVVHHAHCTTTVVR